MNDQDVILKLSNHDYRLDSLEARVNSCEQLHESVNTLAMSVRELTINMAQMCKSQEEQNDRLTALERAPGEAWKDYKRTIINCVTTGVVGAIIGALLALIIK